MNEIKDIIKSNIKKHSYVVVAFSGGPDSVYLLNTLIEIKKEYPIQIILAHFNHKIRFWGSNRDEKFAKNIAKKYGLISETKSIPIKKIAKKNKGNLEEIARNYRYEFLEEIRQKYNADFILTGHHLDDNIETFFMHFLRGAGNDGLRGIQIENSHILRPLLHLNKAGILENLKLKKLKFHIDKSNKNTDFLRNNLRHNVIPIFKKINPNFDETFQRNLRNLNEVFSYCYDASQKWMKKNLKSNFEIPTKKFLNENIAIQKLILINLYKNLYGSNNNLTSQIIDTSLKILKNKKTGKKTGFGRKFFIVYKPNTIEIITRKTQKKIVKKKLKINGITTFIYGNFDAKKLEKIPKNLSNAIYLDYSKLNIPLYIRSKQNGDKICPLGMKGSKKLQDIFTDNKISQHQRIKIPIIIDKTGEIIAFGKNTISEKYKITKKTKTILKLKLSLP